MSSQSKTIPSSSPLKRVVRIGLAYLIKTLLIITPLLAIFTLTRATKEAMFDPTYEREYLLKIMILVADLVITAILAALVVAGASLRINKR